MKDPVLMTEVSFAVELGMTPSEFRRRATMRDLKELVAHRRFQNEQLEKARSS